MMNLDASIIKVLAANCPNHGMPNLRCRRAGLGNGINHTITVREKRRQVAQGNVAILVDSTPKDSPPMLGYPLRVVTPSTKK
jgi:hypothetical protein